VKGSEKVKILKLPYELYEYYKTCVKDNENITRDQAARKLTRNVLLAKEVPQRNTLEKLKGNKMYHYGSLHIVVRRGRVVHLHNNKGKQFHEGWVKDEQRYEELTKKLVIVD
jgi:hypothetical protein